MSGGVQLLVGSLDVHLYFCGLLPCPNILVHPSFLLSTHALAILHSPIFITYKIAPQSGMHSALFLPLSAAITVFYSTKCETCVCKG